MQNLPMFQNKPIVVTGKFVHSQRRLAVEPAKPECRSMYIPLLARGTYRPNCQLSYDASAEMTPSGWPAPLQLGHPWKPQARQKEVSAE